MMQEMCTAENLVLAVAYLGNTYSGINPTKSPASGAGSVSEPWLISQVGNARSRVRVRRCVSAARAVEVPVLVCLRSSCDHVTDPSSCLREDVRYMVFHHG
jgi:hypothetical protein